MWPFTRRSDPEETAPTLSLAKRMDDLELEQLELRDSQEKTLAVIKRIQGRMLKRVQAEEAATPEEGAEAPNGQPVQLGGRVDLKSSLRQRVAQLRSARR